jgi:Zn-dependent metalloprotease
MYDRDGIDGHGQQPRAVVHTGDQMVNAFYYHKVMWYGDGDGVTAGPLVDKDVASHEPTHGLTESSSALAYWGESGALNEAMSDILGSAGYSWFARGHNDTGIPTDFTIGEDCWTPSKDGDALRYMDHPTKDREGDSEAYSRDNYSIRYQGWGDNGGVHLNSGIANNAFYLMAKGGANDTSKINVPDGMGIQDALQIFYRANTVYLTPTSDFASAREATVKAAVDLFGDDSKQVKIAQQAWTAVGVNAPPATPPKFPLPAPTPTPDPVPAPTSSTPAPTSPATLRRQAA